MTGNLATPQAAPPPAAARSQLGGVQPPLPPFHQQQLPLASPSKEQQKTKNAALRFLSRLGSKKDKYQSKDRSGGLQVGGYYTGRPAWLGERAHGGEAALCFPCPLLLTSLRDSPACLLACPPSCSPPPVRT